MRLFLALELPSLAHDRLRSAGDRLRPVCPGWRWVPPENIHLTLRFLGEVDEDRDRRLRERWQECARGHPAIRFRIGPAGVLPHRGRPRILYAEVLEEASPGTIAAVAGSLETAARAAGFAPEERPFRAHLTLARAAREGAPARPPAVRIEPPFEVECFAVTLFRSELSPQGARYSALARFPLRDEAAPGSDR